MARSNILDPQRHRLAEEVRNAWVVNAEEGTTIEDVLQPGYWAHIASRLRPYDHIEVRLETGEWVAQLMVISQGLNWAKVHMLNQFMLNANAEPPPASQKYEVKWGGPQHKWRVVRLADSEVISKGHDSAMEGQLWLQNYERATVSGV